MRSRFIPAALLMWLQYNHSMHQPTTILCSAEEFTAKAAEEITEAVNLAVHTTGHCSLGLSGGSTPVSVYRLLREESKLPWSKMTVFLVDERYVRPDHKDSNQCMVRRTLLASHEMNEDQIIFPDTTLPLEECIADYSQRLRDIHPDVLVLGMGDDAHIASLFPPLSEDAFSAGPVIHTTTDRFAVHDRISLTLAVLQLASSRIFLLSGDAKYQLMQKVAAAKEGPHNYPARALMDDRTLWVVGR